MGTIREDIGTAADWVATALSSSGYATDFSPESLWEIDRFFDDHSRGGEARPRGLLSQDLGQRIFAVGAYMGEVVRRSLGGNWEGDDDDPEAELHVVLQLPDDVRCWPVQRAMKRFRNGPEDGIAAWGSGLGLLVGSPPPVQRPGFFERLFKRS